MARNIELKTRLTDPEAAQRIALRLATEDLGLQEQLDTYFQSRHGRLKLREITGRPAQLVWYARPDQQGPKASDYLLVEVPQPDSLKAALSGALGVRCQVHKRRHVLLYHNVRIHLDEVTGLGRFLEFEAVVGGAIDDDAAQAQVDYLSAQFHIQDEDRLCGSYAEMLGG